MEIAANRRHRGPKQLVFLPEEGGELESDGWLA